MSTDPTKNEVAEVKNVKGSMIERPNYVATLGDESGDDGLLKTMQSYMQPPRLKIIQGQSGAPYKPKFRDGDILVIPQLEKIGDLETPFVFTPLAVFPTFMAVNPFQMKGQLPFIREMSFDENSEVAKKARALTSVPCPENPDFKVKYGTSLNFLIRISDIDLSTSLPIVMFFRSSEFKTGQTLLTMIQERRSKSYLCRFRASSIFNQGPKGSWYGLTFHNDTNPWISEDKVSEYKAESEALRKLVAERQLQIDYEDSDVEGGDASEETRF